MAKRKKPYPKFIVMLDAKDEGTLFWFKTRVGNADMKWKLYHVSYLDKFTFENYGGVGQTVDFHKNVDFKEQLKLKGFRLPTKTELLLFEKE